MFKWIREWLSGGAGLKQENDRLRSELGRKDDTIKKLEYRLRQIAGLAVLE